MICFVSKRCETRLYVCQGWPNNTAHRIDYLLGSGVSILGARGGHKIRKLVATISASLAQSGADPKLAPSIPESLGRCDRAAMSGGQAVVI